MGWYWITASWQIRESLDVEKNQGGREAALCMIQQIEVKSAREEPNVLD
jgi:hypothetical protein